MLAEEIHKKYYPTISDTDFNLIVSADEHTSNLQKSKLGKYAKWLLRLFVKNRLKTEDLYKAKEYIPVFDKLLKSNKLTIRDINKYRSLPAMYAVVKPYLDRPAISNTEAIRITKQNEAEKLYEDGIFTVIYPKTRAASCLYGSNTEWCTAARKYNNFSHYNEQGKLYIIINRINGRKYQFHFETNSYCDETDDSLSYAALEALEKISATEGLRAFFLNERQNDFLFDKSSRILEMFHHYYDDVSIIAIHNHRYGIAIREEDRLVSFILPFEYSMIKESYIPCVYEVTKNDKTDLYLIYQQIDTIEMKPLSDYENFSMKFVLPFDSNYLFPVGKSDLFHFLAFAEKQCKKVHPDYQANCIVTNLFTAILLESVYKLPYDKTVETDSLKKQIDEEIEIEKLKQSYQRKIRNSFWINGNDWFIIVDKEIEDGTIYLQTFDILWS
jgi:hypothetical protein